MKLVLFVYPVSGLPKPGHLKSAFLLLRESDLNRRSSGYEPDGITTSPPRDDTQKYIDRQKESSRPIDFIKGQIIPCPNSVLNIRPSRPLRSAHPTPDAVIVPERLQAAKTACLTVGAVHPLADATPDVAVTNSPLACRDSLDLGFGAALDSLRPEPAPPFPVSIQRLDVLVLFGAIVDGLVTLIDIA